MNKYTHDHDNANPLSALTEKRLLYLSDKHPGLYACNGTQKDHCYEGVYLCETRDISETETGGLKKLKCRSSRGNARMQ